MKRLIQFIHIPLAETNDKTIALANILNESSSPNANNGKVKRNTVYPFWNSAPTLSSLLI